MNANVIVLSFDVMPLSLLGCYGNEWALTPHFDQLAWEGVTFDQHFAADVSPDRCRHSWWTGDSGEPGLSASPDVQARIPLPSGHDIPWALHVEPADEPHSQTKRGSKNSRKKRTSSFERLLQLGLTSAVDLRERGSSTLLWLHYGGLTEPMDPPVEYLELYLDELEDLPDDQRSLDLIRAAATVSHVDHLFGNFRREYEKRFGPEETIWILTAAGSCPVGFEPGINSPPQRLSEGYIHSPLIIASSHQATISGQNAGTRRQQLVQTIDLLPTLYDLFGIDMGMPVVGQSLLPLIGNAATPSRPQIFIRGDAMSGIRTETEFLVCHASNDSLLSEDHFGDQVLLYQKPEDRWEQHEVSRMMPELTMSLLQHVSLFPR